MKYIVNWPDELGSNVEMARKNVDTSQNVAVFNFDYYAEALRKRHQIPETAAKSQQFPSV